MTGLTNHNGDECKRFNGNSSSNNLPAVEESNAALDAAINTTDLAGDVRVRVGVGDDVCSDTFMKTIYSSGEKQFYSYEGIKEIADFLYERTSVRPLVGIICGSGLNPLADSIVNAKVFDYETIPNFPVSTVEGHVGRLIIGYLEGLPVVAMQGRFHYYEGYPLAKCSMPVRVMKLMGVKYLMTTNAAGGLNPKYKVGDIMVMRDHINMMGFAGNSPLQGPNDVRFGPRFPPMTNAYNTNLIAVARKVAEEMGIEKEVHEGVYTCLGGPNYETVAELKMLHILGVDAVGMSTVHEVITARHCDMTVFAFSLITNKCSMSYDTNDEEANHEEVVMVGKSRQTVCRDFLCRILREIARKYQTTK